MLRDRASIPWCAACHGFLADEIVHARVGWAYLARAGAADGATRASVASAIGYVAGLGANLFGTEERRRGRRDERRRELALHGVCSAEEQAFVRDAFVPASSRLPIDRDAVQALPT
jgi:hypothetical protein